MSGYLKLDQSINEDDGIPGYAPFSDDDEASVTTSVQNTTEPEYDPMSAVEEVLSKLPVSRAVSTEPQESPFMKNDKEEVEADDDDDDDESSSDAESESSSSSESVASVVEVPTASVFIPRKRRLPKDTIGHLEDLLAKEGSHASLKLYNDLILEYAKRTKFDSIRQVYERSLIAYPSVASQWIAYVDMEQSAGEFAKADDIYRRAVEAVTSLPLWTHYLNYVRRRNNVISGGDAARQTILQAFELVTNKIGIDVRSGKIWKEYIDFIKSAPEGKSTWETQQKMDLLRKVYQRVVCIPVEGLETLWQDYNSFENGLNSTTARKFVSERAPAYLTARSCLKKLQSLSSQLDRTAIPTVPKWRDQELNQLDLWNSWISWERSDPLGFTAEDRKSGMPGGQDQVTERVLYAYRQALQPLRFYPQMWFDMSEYCLSVNMLDLQLALLKEGTAGNPGSCLLHFRLAEVYELAKKKEDAKKTYQALADSIVKEIKLVEATGEEKKNALQSKEETKSIYSSGDKGNDDDDEDPPVKKKNTVLDLKIQRVEEKTSERVSALSKDLTLCNTMYMRAMKRMEGLKAARQVFSDARKLSYSTYHIFVASALMEYHHNKSPDIASKIFEIGLRRFADTIAFVEKYLEFLITINDDTNARALFERTVSKLSTEDVKPLFRKFYAYEAAYGSELSAVSKLENRMLELYPDDKPIARFAGRYTLDGHSVIGETDVGPIVLREIMQEESGTELLPESNSTKYEIPAGIATDLPLFVPSEMAKNAMIPPGLTSRTQKRVREEPKADTRKRTRKRDKEKLERKSTPEPTRDSYRDSPSRYGNGSGSSAGSSNLPDGITRLLSLLPPTSSYNGVVLDPQALCNLIHTTRIPSIPPSNANLTRFKRG
ncbi:hypothetical protein V1512DRAFT_262863 [Lipomyces arxii]|uniref:uncharacterized protein n=1 Tax=Lipomyces arxii TaxID=56418 RepID=UPI0034CF9695